MRSGKSNSGIYMLIAAVLLLAGVIGIRMCVTGAYRAAVPVGTVVPAESCADNEAPADSVSKTARKKVAKKKQKPERKPTPSRSYLDEPVDD